MTEREPEKLNFERALKISQERKPVDLSKQREDAAQSKLRSDKHRHLAILARDCGERLAGSSIDGFDVYDEAMNQTLSKILEYIVTIEKQVEAGNSIYLIGPPGTGKDHLAIAVAREAVLRLGCSARWLDAAKFRSELRDAIKSTKDERTTFAPYLAAGVLIISDPVSIGSALTDYQADCLFRIIDGRYRDRRPTFITSNVKTQAEAESLLGSQIVDRLSHGGLRLRCSWESFRARGKK